MKLCRAPERESKKGKSGGRRKVQFWVAPFSQQRDVFSMNDSHAFNRQMIVDRQ